MYDNPFNETTETVDVTNNKIIEIWNESQGRRNNTYTTGWIIPETDMKEHLKQLKKKLGCNGSIKEIDTSEGRKTTMHLQGSWVDQVTNYIKSIDSSYTFVYKN